jgi:type I restriction-modification system DNA methylase subunit
MAAARHLALFHPRLVRDRIGRLDPNLFRKHQATLSVWLAHLHSGALDDTKAVSFLERIFGDVLGYRTMAMAREGKWELVAEKMVLTGGSADGALGFFERGKSYVVAPIELEGAAQIQQGWDYANKTPESRWVIVSNYREIRLYAKSKGQAAYELFRLEDLAKEEGFGRFVALLGRDALLGGPAFGESPLAEMLLASERIEHEVTERLYSQYSEIRERLFAELRRKHSNIAALELLAKTQTILDRLIFIAFAEDRQLLPANTLAKAFEHRDPYFPRPVWSNFLAVFRSVDKGNPELDIPGYNGGLFRDLEGIEALEVSDEMCAEFKQLGEYDFHEDVSVDVLGHIFEQSIVDLEPLREEAARSDRTGDRISASTEPPTTRKKPSKRKVEGIFYTPPFVTSFLVRETLGRAMADAWERAGGDQAGNEEERIAAWEAYQGELRGLRVLDPACGSGAFLVAVFDSLAHEFERVNRALAEIRDQGQTSLFDLSKSVLNENLFGIDRNGESVEISRLVLWLKTAERGKKLTFLDRNIRMGNSVVDDPKVDPWAFDWDAGRVARDFRERDPPPGENVEAIDARWREGFDVVLGNPPYVRQERLAAYKDHWRHTFRVYDGSADLFVYFFERGLRQLKPGGRLGFIVSNKWLRGGYAERLRELLAKEYTIESIVDFGHAPVFPDADAFPCTIVVRKQAPLPDHEVSVTQYPREQLGKELLASYVETYKFPLPQRPLGRQGWSLEPPAAQGILDKLRRNGVPLGDYASVKPYYGIKTGCNEAFLIDQATKDKLCQEDPRSSDILKKVLRGQDVARWSPEWGHRWMIFVRRGVAIDRYPAVKSHLNVYRAQLEPRPKDYDGDDWPGRKPGSYEWYEIQDSVDYHEQFERPKLIYQVIQFHPRYALDRAGYYTNDKAFFLPTEDPWLLASLNSPAMWWHNWRYLVHMKDEALNPAGDKMVHVPIPRPSAARADLVASHVETIVQLTCTVSDANSCVLDVLRMEWDIDKPGQALADFSALGSDAFVLEVKKRRSKGSPRLTPTALGELRRLYEDEAPPVLDKRARIITLEREIAAAVHDAYGLDAADLALLRATAPPRMPPG